MRCLFAQARTGHGKFIKPLGDVLAREILRMWKPARRIGVFVFRMCHLLLALGFCFEVRERLVEARSVLLDRNTENPSLLYA